MAMADPSMADDGNVGPINTSPSGGVLLHILNRNHVAFLDYVGSGNETAKHTRAGSPITLMVCAFDEADAAIVRLYGWAKITTLAQSELADQLLQNGDSDLNARPRQVIEVMVDKTSTSCGYGVPVMSLVRQRRTTDRGQRYKT
ncbi:MAG: hypothetical protein WCL57_08115 [Chloroflexota bacterium]